MSRARTCILILAISAAAAAQTTYTVDYSGQFNPTLREIDITTGATITALPLNGSDPNGLQGLAIDPTTGVFYAIDNALFQNRSLITINPTTGATGSIGSLGVAMADLAIDQNGTLYGIEGNTISQNSAGNLYTIDKSTAAKTLVASLGGSTAGGIAVSPLDGLIYRAGRNGTGTNTLWSIDPGAAFAATAIGTVNFGESNSLGFEAGGDLLSAHRSTFTLYRISTTTAAATLVGTTDHFISDVEQGGVLSPSFPGTSEDLATEVAINAGAGVVVSNPSNDTLALVVGDFIAIRHISAGGTFDFIEFLAFGTAAPTGTSSISPVPGLHVMAGGGGFLLTPPAGILGLPFTLSPNGYSYGATHIGGALSGVSTLIHGLSITGTAANNIFASTNGLLIDFL